MASVARNLIHETPSVRLEGTSFGAPRFNKKIIIKGKGAPSTRISRKSLAEKLNLGIIFPSS